MTTQPYTVLVVDDEPAVRELARDMLEERGYRVLAAGDAAQALNLLTLEPVGLLITDVLMPRMNGFDLARAAQQVRPDLKVLYISGYAQKIAHRMTVPGPILTKPYRQRDLIEAVEECLRDGTVSV